MADRLKTPLKLLAVAGLLIVLSGLLAVAVYADFSEATWRSFKAVNIPPGLPPGSLVDLEPDLEVFAHADPSLRDLRIVEVATQREVPYKLLVERGEQRRVSLLVTIRDLSHVPGQHTSFVVDLGQARILHNELEIRTPSQNFQRTVVVEGSTDGEAWAILEEDAQIFDFTIQERNFNAADTRLQYPASTVRFLRIRIINGDEPPLEVQGASAFFSQKLEPRETELPAAPAGREENPEQQRSRLLFDLGTQGFLSIRLSLAIAQDNFYRRVSLEGSQDGQLWVMLQRSEDIYAFNTPKFVGSKLEVHYPESGFRFLRLTIFNEDNPPLDVGSATAFGVLRKLVFAAEPQQTYRLYYGNDLARPPSYELERIFPYLVTENLPQAGLGPHSANPNFAEPQKPSEAFTERYPWLLPIIVAVAALFIGIFLTSLIRQLRRVLPPPPEAS